MVDYIDLNTRQTRWILISEAYANSLTDLAMTIFDPLYSVGFMMYLPFGKMSISRRN